MSGVTLKNKVNTKKGSILDSLSLKKLTLLGFSLVALPLVIALIYSATQINKLALESKQAIFNSVDLNDTNRGLSESLVKMERYASQSVVLSDPELLNSYFAEEDIIVESINNHLMNRNEQSLKNVSRRFLNEIKKIHQLLSGDSSKTIYLTQLQDLFRQLTKINQEISKLNSDLIFAQSVEVRTSARLVWQAMLKSLFIIPITILIAIFFVVRITKPLKQLIKEIQMLEKGNFEHEINFRSSPEVNEITDALEVMRMRLHALELQKSSFIRHISHELKTPLTAVREGSELLYDDSVGVLNKAQREIIELTRDGGYRLQQLIEDLLNFNIVLDSTSLQDSEKIHVSTLINNVIRERKLDIKSKNIKMKINCKDISLYSNGKQLAVILDNLLSNAIKYSPTNGTITLSAEIQLEQLSITLTDEGVGLSESTIEQIFDAFYQGPPPIGNKVKSSGLGLTIVKELLMRINGTIEVQSIPTIPKGASFKLVLPRAFKTEKK